MPTNLISIHRCSSSKRTLDLGTGELLGPNPKHYIAKIIEHKTTIQVPSARCFSVSPLRVEAPLRRCATRASLSRPVHPSGSDFHPSTRRPRRWPGHFSLARFRSQKQEASDDAADQRVPAPIPAACAAAWIRPHPPLRVDGSLPAQRIAAALLTTAWPIRPGPGRSWVCRKGRLTSTTALDVPAMRRTDGSDRAAQPRSTSLARSADAQPATTMNRSFSSRLCYGFQHQHNTCACVTCLMTNRRCRTPREH